jgi:hypothetical protein
VLLYLVDLYCACVDCLEGDCMPRLICLGFHSTIVHQLLAHEGVFWIGLVYFLVVWKLRSASLRMGLELDFY